MPGLPSKVHRNAIPHNFPTHRNPPEFWEELGRTIATFGFLEDMLVKAYFAITATTSYEFKTEEEAEAAVEEWRDQLLYAMADTLVGLAQRYAAAVRGNELARFPDINVLEVSITNAAGLRNALCHGFWGVPDAFGKSDLSYFRMPGKKVDNFEKLETRIDVAWLRQLRTETVELAYDVIDSVTVMGFKFPSGLGLGDPIWRDAKP
jgi:hypothetical protein